MKPVRWMLVVAVVLGLVACGHGPVKRINPPSASIQELAVQADGSWSIALRLQNFSTVPMTFSSVRSQLRIDGDDAGELVLHPDIDIVGENAEVVRATLRPSTPLVAGNSFAYTLKGRIEASAPKSQGFDFDHSSRLSPVPGIPNTWR